MLVRLGFLLFVVAGPLAAQDHSHGAGAGPVRQSGQAAFLAIAETVALLSADSTTDWSKVDIEALRQHLIDMDDVVMRARVTASPVEGGVRLAVVASGRALDAVHRIVGAHAQALDQLPAYRANATRRPDGEILVVAARDPTDRRTVLKIRALGLGGLLTEGSHHAAHHLMIARGAAPPGHTMR